MTFQHVKSDRTVTAVCRWIDTAVAAETIDAAQAVVWRQALTTALEDLKAREDAVTTAQANLVALVGSGVVDAVFADVLRINITLVVKRLAHLARDAATNKELVEIDLSACAILDAVDALCSGVVRPAELPETNTDIGA